jgi:hypothetical protein
VSRTGTVSPRRWAAERYNGLVISPPLCPTCGQPASEALGGPEHDWECRNEACPEFGQPVQADEPESGEPTVEDSRGG